MQRRQKFGELLSRMVPLSGHDVEEILSEQNSNRRKFGDIALAWETCTREAAEKGVGLKDHAAHLIVHGLLHLAGHDHETGDAEAAAMEALEIKALAQMGIADPYGDRDTMGIS